MNREELMDLFSEKIRELLARLPVDYEEVQEIRLRAEKPLLIRYGTREYFVTEDGKLSEEESEGFLVDKKNSWRPWSTSPIIRCMPMRKSSNRAISRFGVVIASA